MIGAWSGPGSRVLGQAGAGGLKPAGHTDHTGHTSTGLGPRTLDLDQSPITQAPGPCGEASPATFAPLPCLSTEADEAAEGDGPTVTNADQFEAFVREYQDLVFATAVRLLGNAADAEDVSQTVFLRAYERFAQIGTSDTVAGWLKTVATNLSLNHLSRYRARWKLFSELRREEDEGETSPFEESVAAPHTGVLTALLTAEREAALESALQALPDHQRVPLVLFHFEQKSYQEIAALLEVPLSKVKSDMHRGREALKKAWPGTMHQGRDQSPGTTDQGPR